MAPDNQTGRPESGLGHYLRDIIYGASDGVVTTVAIVAGATGAKFDPLIGLVLGLAKLGADGFSMASSNYLGLKSELEQTGGSVEREEPWRHALVTLVAFIIAGAVPLAAYLFPAEPRQTFAIALTLSLVTLTFVGGLRSKFIRRPAWLCAGEMVLIGGAASGAAYVLGMVASLLL